MTREQWLDFIVGKPFHIAITVALGLVAHIVLRRVIRRFTAAMAKVPAMGRRNESANESTRRSQRAGAVGQLLRSGASIAVWTTTVLIVMETAGFNIAPLLASAGIVGVAIGFGAQSLVKDYFAGIVIVIEDQYGIGDDVEIDGIAGQVAEVGLRTTRLRAQDGSIVWVRNGDIVRVRNRSQGTGPR
ncbi:MAG: hypothetical protein RL745_1040 [Actinomycetota bacterium]